MSWKGMGGVHGSLTVCLSLTCMLRATAAAAAAGGGNEGGGECGWMLGRRVYISLLGVFASYTHSLLSLLHPCCYLLISSLTLQRSCTLFLTCFPPSLSSNTVGFFSHLTSLDVFLPRLTRSRLRLATSIVPLEQLPPQQHNTKSSTDSKRPTSVSHIAYTRYLHVPKSPLRTISFKAWTSPLSL
jgi:hypothetical protein